MLKCVDNAEPVELSLLLFIAATEDLFIFIQLLLVSAANRAPSPPHTSLQRLLPSNTLDDDSSSNAKARSMFCRNWAEMFPNSTFSVSNWSTSVETPSSVIGRAVSEVTLEPSSSVIGRLVGDRRKCSNCGNFALIWRALGLSSQFRCLLSGIISCWSPSQLLTAQNWVPYKSSSTPGCGWCSVVQCSVCDLVFPTNDNDWTLSSPVTQWNTYTRRVVFCSTFLLTTTNRIHNLNGDFRKYADIKTVTQTHHTHSTHWSLNNPDKLEPKKNLRVSVRQEWWCQIQLTELF